MLANDVTTTTFHLPEAPPQLYLRWIEWWREANRFMVSAATLGAMLEPSPGRGDALDYLDFVAPRCVEEQASRALEEGRARVSPTLDADVEVAVQARTIAQQRLAWLLKMEAHGAPRFDPDLQALMRDVQTANDRTLAAAGVAVDR